MTKFSGYSEDIGAVLKKVMAVIELSFKKILFSLKIYTSINVPWKKLWLSWLLKFPKILQVSFK